MKRSKMVELIRDIIVDCQDLRDDTIEDQKDVASLLLSKIEEAGMAPPETFVYEIGCIDRVYKNEWDKE